MRLKKVLLSVIIVSMLVSLVAVAGGWKQNIEVEFNSVNLEVNGTNVDADNILYNGTTYVPLRRTAEILGCDVGWDGNTNTAKITQYDDNYMIGCIFFDLSKTNNIYTFCKNIINIAEYNFTKSHWINKVYENNESNFDFLTDYFNWISEQYKYLTDYKNYFYQNITGITSNENINALYTNLDNMYGKLCYIYSAVNNLVNASGYVCSEYEFGNALSELHSLSLNIDSCHNEIYYDVLDYLLYQ